LLIAAHKGYCELYQKMSPVHIGGSLGGLWGNASRACRCLIVLPVNWSWFRHPEENLSTPVLEDAIN